MGSDPRDSAPPNFDESPLHRVELPAFYLSRKPVSNEQYARFVEATGHPAPAHWIGDQPAERARPPQGRLRRTCALRRKSRKRRRKRKLVCL